MHHLSRATAIAAALAVVFGWLAACGADTSGNAVASNGAGGQGGVTASGGAAAEGGAGGLLCGIDCGTITTPPCQQAVCNAGQHPGPRGQCVVIDRRAGTVCDDGLFCTADDACVAGACIGGGPNHCGLPSSACIEINCNEVAEVCSQQPLADEVVCTPDDLCQQVGECQAGQCQGAPKGCFFEPVPDDCHVSQCNPDNGLCEPVVGNEAGACQDLNALCTLDKTCSAGVCIGGVAVDCSALSIGCKVGACDDGTGQCVAQPAPNGSSCDDGDYCTLNDSCAAGSCDGSILVTSCTGGDLCCPAGCNDQNDSDCILNILLLGDDVADVPGNTGWSDYRAALFAAGVNWNEHNLDVVTAFPSLSQLQQYNTLIWMDQSSIAAGNAEAQRVADWLQGPGVQRLMVTSRDFMWDFATAAAGTGEHNLYALWGVGFLGTSAGNIATIDTVVGDPLTGSLAPSPIPHHDQLRRLRQRPVGAGHAQWCVRAGRGGQRP